MSRRPRRRNHAAVFKANVALEAAKEALTLTELSQRFGGATPESYYTHGLNFGGY